MDLISIGFAILIIKVSISILPGVYGFFLIFSSTETKREIRNKYCKLFFGVSNAMRTKRFARILYFFGFLFILLSCGLTWHFVVRVFLELE